MSEELRYSQKDFDKLIENIGNKPVSPEAQQQKSDEQQYKDLQLAHLSLKMMIDDNNLQSMSCLTEAERNDFANAEYINEWLFQDPMYETFKKAYLEMSRSVNSDSQRKPFYQGIFSMVSQSFASQPSPSESGVMGTMRRVLGR